ncbi:unnamed protein product [marine sediment metagenome]|uniref:Uncharacterized protein n=1 Tax=marine sediment metagenome TaxID=412755 RepID=X1JLV2_9ZZZZ
MQYPYTPRKTIGKSLYYLWCEGNFGYKADTPLTHSNNMG